MKTQHWLVPGLTWWFSLLPHDESWGRSSAPISSDANSYPPSDTSHYTHLLLQWGDPGQCPGRRVLHVQPRGHQSDSVREPPFNVSDLVQAFVPLDNGGGTKLYLNPSEAGLYSEGQHHERLK